ncbi:Uu.00g008950.m01.CDS01 [Anthostomella pinea]|uniref:Uu.00g008950.m01.CDS01 n=1 Tax=Anthostomella pinea TaxID=933095 RepID=A0AAI8VRJ4_9PEZI|nr:Uu.00g008950.m01.CDS01 [Anthostomella pinea]
MRSLTQARVVQGLEEALGEIHLVDSTFAVNAICNRGRPTQVQRRSNGLIGVATGEIERPSGLAVLTWASGVAARAERDAAQQIDIWSPTRCLVPGLHRRQS